MAYLVFNFKLAAGKAFLIAQGFRNYKNALTLMKEGLQYYGKCLHVTLVTRACLSAMMHRRHLNRFSQFCEHTKNALCVNHVRPSVCDIIAAPNYM
jgi:hypothetical protein